MRTYDFTPFSRSAIGFDRLFDLLNSGSVQAADNFPPYDIIRTGEASFRINLAVAGFTPDDITVMAQQNLLTVTGHKADERDGTEFLYKSIAAKAFERRFNLADHIEVQGARFEHGLLQIDLVQQIPEAMKPRRVEIRPGTGAQVPPRAA